MAPRQVKFMVVLIVLQSQSQEIYSGRAGRATDDESGTSTDYMSRNYIEYVNVARHGGVSKGMKFYTFYEDATKVPCRIQVCDEPTQSARSFPSTLQTPLHHHWNALQSSNSTGLVTLSHHHLSLNASSHHNFASTILRKKRTRHFLSMQRSIPLSWAW